MSDAVNEALERYRLAGEQEMDRKRAELVAIFAAPRSRRRSVLVEPGPDATEEAGQ